MIPSVICFSTGAEAGIRDKDCGFRRETHELQDDIARYYGSEVSV